MTWVYHRYAVERARDRMKKLHDEAVEAQQGVSLQSEATGSDAELLDEVVEFLSTLDGYQNENGSIGFLEGAERRDAFVWDWNKTIAQIGVFCKQYNIPEPELLFHPRVLDHMNAASSQRISGTLIYMGVKVRFGGYEQRDVLVSYPR